MKRFCELANGQHPDCTFMIKGLDARFAAKPAGWMMTRIDFDQCRVARAGYVSGCPMAAHRLGAHRPEWR